MAEQADERWELVERWDGWEIRAADGKAVAYTHAFRSNPLDWLETKGRAQRIVELPSTLRSYMDACQTIAQMHGAAVGGFGRGPIRGVVEDVADLKASRDALAERVRELEEHREAWRSRTWRLKEALEEVLSNVEVLGYVDASTQDRASAALEDTVGEVTP